MSELPADTIAVKAPVAVKPRGSASGDVIIALIAFAILASLPFVFGSKSLLDFVIRCSAFGLFATSLNLLVGYTGMISFGHGMFFGLGAYGFGLIMQRSGWPIPAAFVATLAISAVVAIVIGAICVRLKDIYFAFVTLAFQMLIHSTILSWASLTGGDQGLRGGIPRPAFLGIDLTNQVHLYFASCVLLLTGLLLMRQIAQSPFGYTLRMIRDNAARASFVGIDVWRAKLMVFVLAALFASTGGIIMSLFVSGAYPEFAYWTISGEGIFINMLGGVTTFLGPMVGTVSFVPVTFRNTTGANNTYTLGLGAAYVQDQIDITRYFQLIGGVRFDHFDLQSRDRRINITLGRVDDLVSPRAGVVFKPIDNLSIYASYSVSYLPSAGDQFSTLSPGLIIAEPEKFVNKEVGLKYDILPRLQFSTAVYDLDRTNQRLPDPNNAGFFITSGATRTRGFEAALTGYVTDAWQVSGGYAYTDARIVSANSATVVAGNRVGLVPFNTFSLWNRYQFTPQWAAGVGVIHYTNFFASSDNTVILPEFTRVDAAVFYRFNESWRAQLNIENLFDRRYIATADGNNNITPGSPRVFRLSATANF